MYVYIYIFQCKYHIFSYIINVFVVFFQFLYARRMCKYFCSPFVFRLVPGIPVPPGYDGPSRLGDPSDSIDTRMIWYVFSARNVCFKHVLLYVSIYMNTYPQKNIYIYMYTYALLTWRVSPNSEVEADWSEGDGEREREIQNNHNNTIYSSLWVVNGHWRLDVKISSVQYPCWLMIIGDYDHTTLYVYCIYIYIYICVLLCNYLFIYVSIYFIYLVIYLFVCIYADTHICIYIYIYTYVIYMLGAIIIHCGHL